MGFVVAACVGGVILFVWGFLAWAIVPLHTPFMKRFTGEEEDAVRQALRKGATEPGLYLVPGFPHGKPDDPEKKQAIEKIYEERYREGPVAFLAVKPTGGTPMSVQQLLNSFLTQLASSFLASWILWQAAPDGYGMRVALVAAVGVTAWMAAHAPYCNWFHFPFGYTLSLLVDLAIGWTLLGLWLAWMVGA